MGRFATAFPGRFPAVISPTEDDSALAAWLAERCGKLTASRMKDAMSFKKNGEPMQVRSDYMREILAERLTGLSTRHYVTPAMQWGLEHEAEAKAAYEAATGIKLIDSGFYDHPMIDMFGGTPDAEIDNDGLVEIKCPTTGTFVDWVLGNVVPEEHKPQMLAQLACTGRKYCIFVCFDPRLQEENRRLMSWRFEPEEKAIRVIEELASQFLSEVEKLWEAFHSNA